MMALENAQDRPFAWGRRDCALFAADVVEAMTGVDLAIAYRGTYHDLRSALRRIHPQAKSLSQLVTCALGDPVPAAQARRGDVVGYKHPSAGLALAICTGRTAVAPGPDGLVHIPMAQWRSAWRV